MSQCCGRHAQSTENAWRTRDDGRHRCPAAQLRVRVRERRDETLRGVARDAFNFSSRPTDRRRRRRLTRAHAPRSPSLSPPLQCAQTGYDEENQPMRGLTVGRLVPRLCGDLVVGLWFGATVRTLFLVRHPLPGIQRHRKRRREQSPNAPNVSHALSPPMSPPPPPPSPPSDEGGGAIEADEYVDDAINDAASAATTATSKAMSFILRSSCGCVTSRRELSCATSAPSSTTTLTTRRAAAARRRGVRLRRVRPRSAAQRRVAGLVRALSSRSLAPRHRHAVQSHATAIAPAHAQKPNWSWTSAQK